MFVLLDIDGVMVPATSWRPLEILDDGFTSFSSKSTLALQKIISETNATIMLTTSHKFSFSLVQWEKIFQKRGIYTSIGRLNYNVFFLNRKEEILSWLNENPKVKDFVIIDDDKSLNGLPTSLKSKLILTSPMVGLTDELATDAIAILQDFQLSH